jgi:hypothetical protein
MDTKDVINELLAIRGIGLWTTGFYYKGPSQTDCGTNRGYWS